MSDNNKSYRIRTNVGEDKVLSVNINQDFNVLEVLSLKISTDNLYKLHTSHYGCVTGRVLANGGFGIPNAKVSIFIAAEESDMEDAILSYLYPYKAVNSKNANKIRYNLLPEEQLSDCHRNVGTFPSKRTVLDDNNVLEIYDKYYKFTTRTNESGDYLIFGVPTGNQTLHVDIDLSDIGILSQRPRDMIYKGYNITQFENANMFKSGNDLDSLAQIFSQNQNVFVYPFWGEESEGDIAITRRDIEIQYEFVPTCVFMGSMITDEGSSGVSKRCIPSERMGKMDRLVTGNGTIEMIRKTPDGSVEEFIVQGNALIDGDGVWCYQIPMNLDYVRTDEYGNIVRTDDVTKGIPTRASVRFRFSLTEFENEGGTTHLSKVLVPNNPQYYTSNDRTKAEDGDAAILDYAFGSFTDDASFKDLFSNNVYSVKSFIPRFQMLNLDRNKRFSGIKAVNANGSNNPIPYNNIRVDLSFMFTLQCAVFKVLLWVVGVYNNFMSWLYQANPSTDSTGEAALEELKRWLRELLRTNGRCLYIGEGYCPEMDGWYFAPKCWENEIFKGTYQSIKAYGDSGDEHIAERIIDTQSIDTQNEDRTENGNRLCLTRKIDYFIQCVEINLAMEYDVIQFDFYNDWINGLIYVPRWMADVRPKRTFLFNTVRINSKINACLEGGYSAIFSRRYAQQCALSYSQNADGTFTKIETPKGCKNGGYQKCHKSKGRKTVKILSSGGVVHQEVATGNKYAYYFRPCEWLSGGKKCNLFATDIILLGSMEPNNTQGIPQTFEKLTPSTYQLPDTLASTNLGVDGALYGDGDAKGTICNQYASSASLLPPTAESVKKWISTKDMNEPNPYDSAEESNIVTEASGIDWGYSGPGQDSNDLSKLYFPGGHFLGVSCFNSQTNIKSCVNLSRVCEAGTMLSQRQMMLSYKDSQSNDAKPYYFIPTGLISNREINDYGFRNEFATLNYNKLKTKTNPDTLLKEYDFETVFPINFNGELKGKIDDAVYNKGDGEFGSNERRLTIEENSVDYYRFRLGLPKGFTQSDAKKKYLLSNATQVSLPVFENSFYFYFGLKSGSTALDKFYKDFYAECPSMKKYEPEVVVDIVHDADFCYDNGEIKVKVKNIESPKITVDGVGSVSGKVEAYFEWLKGGETYTITVEGENILAITKTITIPIVLPDAFSALSYDVENYTTELFPLDDESEGVGKIIFRNTNGELFSDTGVCAVSIYLNDADEKDGSKYYAKSFINSNSASSIKTAVEQKILSEYSSVKPIESVSSITDLEVTAWKGNADYTFTIWYYCEGVLIRGEWVCNHCGNKVQSDDKPTYACSHCGETDWIESKKSEPKEYESGAVEITMPKDLDVVFDGYEYASYRYLIKPLVKKYGSGRNEELVKKAWFYVFIKDGNVTQPFNWWYTTVKEQKIFSGDKGERRFGLAMYHLKRAILYRGTQAVLNGDQRSVSFSIEGGQPPYDTKLTTGSGENVTSGPLYSILEISSSTGTTDDMGNSGFTMDATNFIAPTVSLKLENGYPVEADADIPSTLNYFYDYERRGVKQLYKLYVEDISGAKIWFYVPSIYRPFFNKALYVSKIYNRWNYGQHYEHVIANAISPHNENESGLTVYDTFVGSEIKIPAPDKEYTDVPSLLRQNGLEIFYNYVQTSGTSITNMSVITGGTYIASVKEEGEYGEYREARVDAHFLGDGWQGYDMRVTYYPICETFAKLLYPINNYYPWPGATLMDRELDKDFISYFPRRHNFWCKHYPPAPEYADLPMIVFGKSESNGGILWNPFLSGMIHETFTKGTSDEDWIRGWISVTTGNTNTTLEVAQPEVIGPSTRQKTDSTYVTGEILRHHMAIPHEVLSAALGKEPGTAEYNALLNEFKFGSEGDLEWGCLGVAESSYGYNNEFGATKEDFGKYVSSEGRTALYTFNPRHAPTISVLRVYEREAFLKLVTNPNEPYYNVL